LYLERDSTFTDRRNTTASKVKVKASRIK